MGHQRNSILASRILLSSLEIDHRHSFPGTIYKHFHFHSEKLLGDSPHTPKIKFQRKSSEN